jgi:integrase
VTKLNWEKAKPKPPSKPPDNRKSGMPRQEAMAEYVAKHELACFKCGDDRPGAGRQSEPRYLSADEVIRLLSKMSDTFRPVAAVCAFAGLRISEALGLHWAEIDFDTKQINVHRQLGPDLTIRNVTKTKASTGVVPVLPALERELKAHRSRQANVGLHLVHRDQLVFTTATGKPQGEKEYAPCRSQGW